MKYHYRVQFTLHSYNNKLNDLFVCIDTEAFQIKQKVKEGGGS